MVINMTTPPTPRDHLGRFIPSDCPDPDCIGRLQPETDRVSGQPYWRCDGLIDPGTTVLELQACHFSHHSGDCYDGR